MPPLLFASEVFRASRHPPGHPLAIPRVSLTVDLLRALGWLPEAAYREAAAASPADLARFHDAAYIQAVIKAERDQDLADADRLTFNLGVNGNPIFGEVFRRPATSCGASLAAADAILAGGIAHCPAGGTHHGLRARASGYCVFNDPVLAILKLLDAGLARVFYLDLDAHFGDGVQIAFADEPRVRTLSIHESGRWPMPRDGTGFTGFGSAGDRGGGHACNCPVPPGFNDSEMAFLLDTVVTPRILAFAPEAIVVQAGADALADDPMTRLSLSNRGLCRAIAAVVPLSPRLLVLGGGGYNPYAVARCWAAIWGTLCGIDVPTVLPAAGRDVLDSVRWRHRRGEPPDPRWLASLLDPPASGPVRPAVIAIARFLDEAGKKRPAKCGS
jgi:acetoin utilization protein AcuC